MAERVTGEAVALDVQPASIMLRAAGTIIDAVTYVGALLLTVWLVTWTAGDAIDPTAQRALGILAIVFFLLVVPMVVEAVSPRRSLGKLAVGARIVRDDGGAIQLRHAFIRALMGVLEIYLTLGGIAAVVGLLNERAKRVGDLLAGTYSQHERVPRYQPRLDPIPAPLQQWSLTADVVRLPDPLTRRIAQFLAQAHGMMPATRERLAASLAMEATTFVSPVPPASAELFLVQ